MKCDYAILDNDMPFVTEPDGYVKAILSDLQGARAAFRESVVNAAGFENWERVLFHTDEAMSWETVRSLDYAESVHSGRCTGRNHGEPSIH